MQPTKSPLNSCSELDFNVCFVFSEHSELQNFPELQYIEIIMFRDTQWFITTYMLLEYFYSHYGLMYV